MVRGGEAFIVILAGIKENYSVLDIYSYYAENDR
jgi:hypothetical protein